MAILLKRRCCRRISALALGQGRHDQRMTQTPESSGRYAPPRTDVADPAVADTLLAARPRSVAWACVLMLASTLIGLVSLLPFVDPPIPGEPAAMTALVWGITLAFTAAELWLLCCVWLRRNWARWVMVALTLIGVALGLPLISEDWSRSPLVAGLGIASALSSAVGAALLLMGPSTHWFKASPTI
jgi:hypothetical protein